VAVEFGRHTDTIRKALAGRLAMDLDRSGLSPAVLWISRDFIASASPSIGRPSEPVSRCKSWGSAPGCGSRTLTSRATG
jgi:hypothetical protein